MCASFDWRWLVPGTDRLHRWSNQRNALRSECISDAASPICRIIMTHTCNSPKYYCTVSHSSHALFTLGCYSFVITIVFPCSSITKRVCLCISDRVRRCSNQSKVFCVTREFVWVSFGAMNSGFFLLFFSSFLYILTFNRNHVSYLSK